MRTKWVYAVAILLSLAGLQPQSVAQQPSQSVQAALVADPPADAQHPARLVVAMADALRKAGDPHVAEQHFATNHSFSDHRIAAETAVLSWLGTLPMPK